MVSVAQAKFVIPTDDDVVGGAEESCVGYLQSIISKGSRKISRRPESKRFGLGLLEMTNQGFCNTHGDRIIYITIMSERQKGHPAKRDLISTSSVL